MIFIKHWIYVFFLDIILANNKQFIYKSTNCISVFTPWFKFLKQDGFVNECPF